MITKRELLKTHLEILLIDNYDSFTFNLVELCRSIEDINLHVLKHDDLSIFRDKYDAIIISPGPGLPTESAFLLDAIDYYVGKVPILGICLGLQAIAEHYGGSLSRLETVFHGIKDQIMITCESAIFDTIPSTFSAGRYHSWVATQKDLPESLVVTATDQHGTIMAIENRSDKCYAVQFHPESYMTNMGLVILQNFIALVRNNTNQNIQRETVAFA